MATDYDAPRKNVEDEETKSIEELKAHRSLSSATNVDEDDTAGAESFELPGADVIDEEPSVRVLPRQQDEFTCTSCFLVRHRSQLHEASKGQLLCNDCAA